MSSLLEQAIIDAKQLREAALKSAEAAVTEKYSSEIKSIMQELVNEELEGMDAEPLEEEVPPVSDAAEVSAGAADVVPPAALDGEDLCPCPDNVDGDGEDREIEIDLDQLVNMASDKTETSPESLAQEFEEEPEPLEESNQEVESQVEDIREVELDIDEDVEINLTEEDIMNVLSEMDINVDFEAVARGWAGQSRAESEEQIHQQLASLKDTEKGAERKELLNKIDELEESIKHYKETEGEYKTLAENLAEKLESVNLANAKLLYINKTLGTPSLNERQTQVVVEAISKAGTAEEAKVIFETLQSTVGATSNREASPQSLSEAVNRKRPAMLVSRPRRSEQTNDKVMQNFAERMRKLAGINKT